MTPYARRLRDRVRKGKWTGRHQHLDIDIRREHAICVCWSWGVGLKRAHVFQPRRPCPCSSVA